MFINVYLGNNCGSANVKSHTLGIFTNLVDYLVVGFSYLTLEDNFKFCE